MVTDELIAAVRSRMAELGWNQQDLAYHANTDPSQVSRVLRKYTEARLSFWLSIFDALDLEITLARRGTKSTEQ